MPEIIAGKYEVMETIGRGGMGTVYKARQTNLDRIVAIKMLSEELAADPEFRARFQQEATVVARLNHPNIVQVHDIEPHNNTFCIIMEFVDGENLQAKIDRDVTLPEQEVVAIGAQVARALAYAHSRGIIHRDIKPDNIHVTPKGVAKVMDFGIARLADSKLKTQTGISMGTPKFMSPEQVTGRNVDGQTDLYSLGICMYYCLAGRPPFDGENAISVATRHLYEQPELPSKLNSSISPAVEKVILKALEKQKQNRYLTGTEVADALDTALGTKTPVRVGSDADASFAGATQKIPTQGYGSVVSSSYSNDNPESDQMNTGARELRPVTNTNMTPLREGSVPELDNDFRTPHQLGENNDPTRNFRLSLLFFGGLVIAAVVLLIVLVLWLRQSDSRLADMDDPTAILISPVERIEAVDAEATRYLTAGQLNESRDLWLQFQGKYPMIQTERVNAEIRAVEVRLPLSEAGILAELRIEEGYRYLKTQDRALAFAYLKAATVLSPALATALTTTTVQNLQRKLSVPPTAADVEAARLALAQAQQMMDANKTDLQTEKLLVQAVEKDFINPTYWATLGDFFLRTNNVDGARVMYVEAAERSTDVAIREQINSKLRQISK